jgi:hypothetical protein
MKITYMTKPGSNPVPLEKIIAGHPFRLFYKSDALRSTTTEPRLFIASDDGRYIALDNGAIFHTKDMEQYLAIPVSLDVTYTGDIAEPWLKD